MSPVFHYLLQIENSTVNRFAAGKGTALVIDIGHSEASVTPVVDGFVLRKGDKFGLYCCNHFAD